MSKKRNLHQGRATKALRALHQLFMVIAVGSLFVFIPLHSEVMETDRAGNLSQGLRTTSAIEARQHSGPQEIALQPVKAGKQALRGN